MCTQTTVRCEDFVGEKLVVNRARISLKSCQDFAVPNRELDSAPLEHKRDFGSVPLEAVRDELRMRFEIRCSDQRRCCP